MSDFIGTVTDEMVQRALDALGTVGTSAAHAAAEALARAVGTRIAGAGGAGGAGQDAAATGGQPTPDQLRELVRAVLAEQPELLRALAPAPGRVSVSVKGDGNLATGVVHGDVRVRGWKFWSRRG
ncbi:hypothetical protein ABT095_21365 [Kitasatospora sp. NPDC002227]|uniref:hypothetical protein n=1 Tax=Kitasatospora sp. NPDC002227 TaxID=3154773 RepID=UPI00332CF5E2